MKPRPVPHAVVSLTAMINTKFCRLMFYNIVDRIKKAAIVLAANDETENVNK